MTNLNIYIFIQQINEAAVCGNVEQLKTLITKFNNNVYYNKALHLACFYGYKDCVEILIPFSDPKYNYIALNSASKNGHIECVKLLIPVSDSKTKHSVALYWSAKNNNIECAKLLLPHSDISIWNKESWEDINFDMRQFIKSYYSKVSLEQSLVENISSGNGQNLKNKKLHKI